MSAPPVTISRATLERWAFALARSSGGLSGVARVFERRAVPMPELRTCEAEIDEIRSEIRDLLFPLLSGEVA